MDDKIVISTFSGAMGLDNGIERAGLSVRLCVEIEKAMADTVPPETPVETETPDILEAAAPTSTVQPADANDSSIIMWICIPAAVIVLGAIVAMVIVKKRKNLFIQKR